MTLADHYLQSVKKEFLRYKMIGEQAMEQLEPAQLFFIDNHNGNSIATIVRHLHGNMISRWTDFFTTDGEKPWRNREAEFENLVTDRETIMQFWTDGWACFLGTLMSLEAQDLDKTIYIRGEAHTVMQAINRQLAHYPSHVGQIVFAAKQLKHAEWYSLSIPKNGAGYISSLQNPG